MRLDRKVAIVTGGSRGIGLAISRAFASEGAVVVMASVDSDEQRQTAETEVTALETASALRCDVSDPTQVDSLVRRVVEQHGRIDILVNNASIAGYGDFFKMTLDEWQRVVDVNYKGVFLCSRAGARVMIDQGIRGRIISTSSLGVFTGSATQFHYSPTKAAVHNFMQSLAVILGPYGITCNSVAPAAILTDMNREVFGDPTVREAIEKRTVVGRLGVPADVAAAYVYFSPPAPT